MLTTIIFFVLGLIASYFIARWQMKKNKIVHFSINSYDIGKGLSNEFPEFQLHYDGKDLADNVMVLKGGFMNTGRNDIDALKGDSDIKLILPEECVIKTVKVLPSTEELHVNSNIKGNIINFGICDFLRTDEYFKYTAIVETSKKIDDLHDKLSFHHRIRNTEKIRGTYIGQQRSVFKKKFYKWMIFIYFIFFAISLVLSFYQKMDFDIYNNATNKEVTLYIDSQSNLCVNEGFFIPFISGKVISSEEFDKEYRIVPVTVFQWDSSRFIFPMVVTFLVFACVGIMYYLTWGKDGHIMKVIKENDRKNNNKK